MDMTDRKTIPMIKTYQYRIYPTIKHAKILFAWLEMLRNLYNQDLHGGRLYIAQRVNLFRG